MFNKKNAPAIPAGDHAPVPSEHTLPMAWVRVSHKSPDHIAARYLYAAYGSNLALAQMTKRCPGVDIVGAGVLRNARLVFAKYLGIIADDAATVPIGVFKCTAADIASLDRYEGLGRSYERILVTVECNGQAVRCFTYLKRDNAPREPSDKYFEVCSQGYADWQFDSRRLRHARDHARKNQKPTAASNMASTVERWRESFGDNAGTYRSDEPIGNGSAEAYNRDQIARARARNRGPRPVGGRLGGAEYLAGQRIDPSLPLGVFKRVIEATRVATTDGSATPCNGAVYLGRNGQRWVKDPKGNGYRRVKD